MPRIPDAQSLGARPVPNSRRPIVSDRSGEILAEGIGQAGQSLSKYAAVQQEKEDQFTYARARSALLQADVAIRRELEDDLDYGTHESRYREAMKKALEGASGLISSPRDKATFSLDSQLAVERGTSEILNNARRLERDANKATLLETLDRNRNLGLQARDEGTRATFLTTTSEMIAGARQNGTLTATEAEQLRQNETKNYAEGYIATLDPAAQVEYLSGRGNLAEYIDPDRRAVMLRQATQLAKNQALAEENEARTRAERAQDLAADQAYKLYAAGTPVKDIPRNVWNAMDGRAQLSLLKEEESNLRGDEVKTDWARYLELKELYASDPAAFRQVRLVNEFAALAPAQRKELIDLQTKSAEGNDDLDAATLTQQVSAATAGWESDKKGPFEVVVQNKVNALALEKGRKLNFEERQQVIDTMLIEGSFDRPWWPDRTKSFYEFSPEEQRGFTPEDYDQIPPADKIEIGDELRRKGLPADPAAIAARWQAKQRP